MLESLPPTVLTELEIIRRQDSLGAISKCLPTLFHALTSEKSTKEFFYDLESQAEQEKQQEKESKEEVIAWLEEKLKVIKKSPLSKHPLVSPTITALEDTLSCRTFNAAQNYVSNVWGALDATVTVMAEFGKNKVLDDWVQIGTRIECKTVNGEFLTEETKPKEIAPTTPLGNLLADQLKQGFIKATFIPATLRPGSKKPTVDVEKGYIEQYSLPECVNQWCLHSRNTTEKYSEDLKTNSLLLFKRLLLLAQYCDRQPLTLPLKDKPSNWQDIDQLNAQTLNGFYLSGLKLDSKKTPFTKEQAISLIEAFLLMASRSKKNRERKREYKIDAEKFVKQRALMHIQNSENNRTFPTNEEFHRQMITETQRMNAPYVIELTLPLVARVCRILTKEAGIFRKGGRPKGT